MCVVGAIAGCIEWIISGEYSPALSLPPYSFAPPNTNPTFRPPHSNLWLRRLCPRLPHMRPVLQQSTIALKFACITQTRNDVYSIG